MSLDKTGFDRKVESGTISISIPSNAPLILLAQVLPWFAMLELILPDLQKTSKGFWWLGRRLPIRIHLGAYILQQILNMTDRETESYVRYNALGALFCGSGIVENWGAPDHTKIQTFRARLSAETQRGLANLISKHAADLGFADPSIADLDSTVQEANAAYPSDASLMQKLGQKVRGIYEALKEKCALPDSLKVDMKAINSAVKGYFFLAKNTAIEVRRDAFENLHRLVKKETYPLITWLEENSSKAINKVKWNTAQAIEQVTAHGRRYLLDVAHFVRTSSIKAGKRLSLHLDAIKCITKNKVGKAFQFGRVFQIARIKGNFAFVLESTDLHMNDKSAITQFIQEHGKTFGGSIKSFATDKGYYSKKNCKALVQAGVEEFHLGYEFTDQSMEDYNRLYSRRAGIEPVIGHIKHGGQLGKSRMKSDKATLAAGYASVFGFNLRQLMRAARKNAA